MVVYFAIVSTFRIFTRWDWSTAQEVLLCHNCGRTVWLYLHVLIQCWTCANWIRTAFPIVTFCTHKACDIYYHLVFHWIIPSSYVYWPNCINLSLLNSLNEQEFSSDFLSIINSFLWHKVCTYFFCMYIETFTRNVILLDSQFVIAWMSSLNSELNSCRLSPFC